jgi:hypothetical protein
MREMRYSRPVPEYLSPGVYVEEIDAGPKPIQGVGTSTVGWVLRHLPKVAAGVAIGMVVGLLLKRATTGRLVAR